jgi:hypothetical protein
MKEVALTSEHEHAQAHDEQDTAEPSHRRAARARARDRGGQGAAGGDVGVAGLFSQAINAGLGHGLPDDLRARFEQSLGTSLDGVRIHTDERAAATAAAFDAHAFAHGQDIFFAAGQYRPGTPEGDQLIAHEVAHTVQQRGAAPTTQHKLAVSESGDSLEHAADHAADAMTRGERASVGTTSQMVARTPTTAPRPQPASGQQSIAQRFPQGITVAIALLPTDVDQVASRLFARHEMLGAVLQRNSRQLIRHPATTRLRASFAQGDHVVTQQDAHDVAEVLAANDRAFVRAADAFAHGHVVVGGDPSAPTVGRPIHFGEHDNAVNMVRTLSQHVGQLPGGSGGGNIRHLAIFTHGWETGLRLGTFHGDANAFVSALGGTLTHDVTVGMYGCSAAGGDHSFAQGVTEGLAQAGHDARVFGHETAAHTTMNSQGREFRAHAGQTGPATGHTNAEMVFTPSFRAEQIDALTTQLGAQRADVERVFDTASHDWLTGAMHRIPVPGGQRAAFHIGFDPDGAVAACQAAWRTEGARVIGAALHAPPSTRHRAAPAAHAPANPPAHVEESAPARPEPATAPSQKNSAAPATPAAPTAQPQEGTLAIVQRPGPLRPRHPGNGMDLHAAPDSHQSTEHIVPGTFVHVVRREGEWTLVQHRDRQGWVPSTNIHDAGTSQEDTRAEAEYRLGVLESGNDAGEYTPDSHRVNVGVASWTGSRVGGVLRRYQDVAGRRGQLAALHAHFGGEAHWNELVARFAHPDMRDQQVPDGHGGTRTWAGPQLSPEEQQQFQTAETALPFIREADEQQVHADIDMYLRAFAHTAYPFFGADHSISEVALNVIISGFHQGGMAGLPARIHTTNAFFGVNTHPQDARHRDAPQSPALVRAQTDELTYLRHLGSLLPSRTRYAQIISQYADSPRRYPVP